MHAQRDWFGEVSAPPCRPCPPLPLQLQHAVEEVDDSHEEFPTAIFIVVCRSDSSLSCAKLTNSRGSAASSCSSRSSRSSRSSCSKLQQAAASCSKLQQAVAARG